MLAQPDFKSAMTTQWNAAAHGWNANGAIIRQWLRESTDAMIHMAAIRAGMNVLDVAAGAGDQTLDIAAKVGSAGHVVATDIAPYILEFAAHNAAQVGHNNIETIVADGENLPFDDASFDAAISRLGLMFFPDPQRGVNEIYRVLKPGGRFCAMVFSSPQTNPCLGIMMSTALKYAGLTPGDPYRAGGLLSLGKPGLIDTLLVSAGFRECVTTRVSAPFRLPSAHHYLEFVRGSAAPILQIMAKLDEASRASAWAEMEAKLSAFNSENGWAGPNELLLTTGVK